MAVAREAAPDLVVEAGDIYDRAVPPPEAAELLDDVLFRLVGVVSHVAEPTERIDTRIEISRAAGASSLQLRRRWAAPHNRNARNGE